MDVVQLGFADRVGLGDHREHVGVLEETIELGIVRAVPRVGLLDVIDRLDGPLGELPLHQGEGPPLRKVGREPTGTAALPASQMESGPASRCRAVEAPPPATRTKSKANPAVRVHVGRRSPWGWAVFSCSGVGCFGAPLICSVVVGVPPSPLMSGWCRMLGGV